MIKNKKLFAFDLDGTLTASKSPIDAQAISMLESIVKNDCKIVIISGGSWNQFKNQLIKFLPSSLNNKIHCFPTSGASYYKWVENNWRVQYEFSLTETEKNKIITAFNKVLKELNHSPPKIYGEILEDRRTQITFSALGQDAPLHLKKKWDPDSSKRRKMIEILAPMLTSFDVRLGGTTSIDVTLKGCDKKLAIEKIKEHSLISSLEEMVYFGDRLFPGGNDYPVYLAGVDSIPVDNHIDCIWKVKLLL